MATLIEGYITNLREITTPCVYVLKCTGNLRLYVGSTINLYGRIVKHMELLRNRRHPNKYLQESHDTYGKESFRVIVLHKGVPKDKLTEIEEYYAYRFKAFWFQGGFNMSKGIKYRGGRLNNNYGKRWDNTTRAMVSEIVKERFRSAEYRDKMRSTWEKVGEKSAKFWADNPEKKAVMALKLKEAKQRLRFHALCDNGRSINSYTDIEAVIKDYPEAKWQNIYNSANGYKRRHQGVYWASFDDNIAYEHQLEILSKLSFVWTGKGIENRSEIIKIIKGFTENAVISGFDNEKLHQVYLEISNSIKH